MSDTAVLVPRFGYLIDRVREQFVKHAIRAAARLRPGLSNMAVIPTEYVGMNIAVNGLYERHQLRIVEAVVEAEGLRGTVVADIGANIGNHALTFADWFDGVLAFEPNPVVAGLLRLNARLTGRTNLQIFEVGLGDVDADLPFAFDTAGNDGRGSFASVKDAGAVTLPVRVGDVFLREAAPMLFDGSKRLGFVKCDVEGFEPQVFKGLAATLGDHAPLVMFEYDHRGPGAAAFAVLKALGYDHVYAIRETGDTDARLRDREIKRLVGGYRFWLEALDGPPAFWTNLIVSRRPLKAVATR